MPRWRSLLSEQARGTDTNREVSQLKGGRKQNGKTSPFLKGMQQSGLRNHISEALCPLSSISSKDWNPAAGKKPPAWHAACGSDMVHRQLWVDAGQYAEGMVVVASSVPKTCGAIRNPRHTLQGADEGP